MTNLLLANESAAELATTKLESGVSLADGSLVVTPTLSPSSRRRRLAVQLTASFDTLPESGGAIYLWLLRRHEPVTGPAVWDSGQGSVSPIVPLAYARNVDHRLNITLSPDLYYLTPSTGTNFTHYPEDGRGWWITYYTETLGYYVVPPGVTSLTHRISYRSESVNAFVGLHRHVPTFATLASRTGFSGTQTWIVTTPVTAGQTIALNFGDGAGDGATVYLDSWEIHSDDGADYPPSGTDIRPAGPPDWVVPITPGVTAAQTLTIDTAVFDLLTSRPVRLAVENGTSTTATIALAAQFVGDTIGG